MDNTEARYAEIARIMVETGDWVTPHHRYGEAFWSKPPLSMWLSAIAYLVLGANAFAARFASLLPGLGVTWLVYDMAVRRGRRDTALKAALVLFTTPLFFVSVGAVMTDAALTFATTLSMAAFWYAMTRSGRAGRVWGYLFFVGLAIGLLAKGPVGAVLTLGPVGVWTLWKGGVTNVWRRLPWIGGSLLMVALALPWYLAAEARTPGFLDYFIVGEHFKRYLVAGWSGDRFGTAHARPRGTIWLYAVATTLPWCAVWAGIAWKRRRAGAQPAAVPDDGWRAYLWLWLLASPVFFTPAGNILATYVLPGLPAFALLVAQAWAEAADAGRDAPSTKLYGALMPVLMIAAVLFVLPRVAPAFSQKALVVDYLDRRASSEARLIYLGPPPLSAQFYAAGKVTEAASPAALERMLDEHKADFVVLSDAQLVALPGFGSRLAPIARSGRYQLFREQNPAGAKSQ
jgi:4-amino-4-deoxy-L-arabinose transferase-like glycosyltransferase